MLAVYSRRSRVLFFICIFSNFGAEGYERVFHQLYPYETHAFLNTGLAKKTAGFGNPYPLRRMVLRNRGNYERIPKRNHRHQGNRLAEPRITFSQIQSLHTSFQRSIPSRASPEYEDYRIDGHRFTRRNQPQAWKLRQEYPMAMPPALGNRRTASAMDEAKPNNTSISGYNSSLTNEEITAHLELESFLQGLENCLVKTHPCRFVAGFALFCQFHCAIKAVPNTHPLAPLIQKSGKILNTTIRGICNPVKTTFEVGWKHFVENADSVHSFVKWVKKMGIDLKGKVKADIEKLSKMLLAALVKYGQTPVSILKEALGGLETAISITDEGSLLFHGFNPGCFALELQTSANKFVDIFYRHPAMIDVLLSGTGLLINAGKKIPGPHQKTFSTIALANELLVGTSCAILYWIGARGAICDQISGVQLKEV